MPDFGNLITQSQAIFGDVSGSLVSGVTQGTSFTIEQLDSNGETLRTIVLRDRFMPYREVEWEVQQRVKTTWYPGNPVATQQVLGPMEMPTTIKGMWKDRFAAGALEIDGIASSRRAADAVSLFHDLVRAGLPLRVSWFTEVRIGIMTRFTPSYDRATDVEWEAEFEWQSRGDAGEVRLDPINPPAALGTDLFGQLLDVIGTISDVARLARNFQAALIDLVNEIGDAVAGLVEVLEIANTLASLPATVAAAVAAQVNSIVDRTLELLRLIERRPTVIPEVRTLVSAPTVDPTSRAASRAGTASARGQAPPGSAVANTVDFVRFAANLSRAALDLTAWASDSEALINARIEPEPERFVDVPEGANLFGLSTRFYGSPDFAAYLAAINRLGSANVPPGFRLRVPPRPVGAVVINPTSGTDGAVCRA